MTKGAWKLVRCPNCGYDVAGNASDLCPECGLELPCEPASPVHSLQQLTIPLTLAPTLPVGAWLAHAWMRPWWTARDSTEWMFYAVLSAAAFAPLVLAIARRRRYASLAPTKRALLILIAWCWAGLYAAILLLQSDYWFF